MEKHEIEVDDGTRLHFGLLGPKTGVPLLLCHGLGAGGAQFESDMEWFAARDFRVLVPDLRGHGRSGLPARVEAGSFATSRLRADIYSMIDHIGMTRVHWIGNSLGGILGLGASVEAPERLASLSIFGTALALDVPARGWMLALMDRVPGRRIAARMTAISTTHNRAARPLIEAMLNQYDVRGAGAIVDDIRRYDLTEAARAWTGPGLILTGGKDRAVNRALLPQLVRLNDLPNWRIAHLADGGHCANLDAREDWRREILSFVTKAAGPGPGAAG
ncbi:Lysophospholipase, alpha-beta hydrolase superfamily [Devosia lucknowensis]|uniref:Lysophospholipase, alpha-beta hydrolase superfamily n=1 Tax=Devosia lucknowensis TaxID=1096929 RepID=A0A1Y6G642_9HYPH|nr:alpha/beta fold hydrolase [Devosia lucknowensis]SMQ85632.1 Lysophospholipase, alpha-beta hydrolase superfamily [Devosia lucknowensis]